MGFFKKVFRKLGFKDLEHLDATRERVDALTERIEVDVRFLKSSIASEATERLAEDRRLFDRQAEQHVSIKALSASLAEHKLDSSRLLIETNQIQDERRCKSVEELRSLIAQSVEQNAKLAAELAELKQQVKVHIYGPY